MTTQALRELRDKVGERMAEQDRKRAGFYIEAMKLFDPGQMVVICGIRNYAVESDRDMLALLDALIQEAGE